MKKVIVFLLMTLFLACSKDIGNSFDVRSEITDFYETTGAFSNIQYLIDIAKPGNTIHLLENNIYIQDNSLVLKDGIIINGHGATLKRNVQQTTTSTNTVYEKAKSIDVQKVPNTWKVGDNLQIYSDNSFLTSSYKSEIIIQNIIGNTIYFFQPITRSAAFDTYLWKSGSIVRKVYPQITSTRSYDLFTIPTAWTLKNLVLDGNKNFNSGNLYWGVNMAISNNGKSEILNCKFLNMPNETLLGSGFSIKESYAENINGSFYHQSADYKIGYVILGGEIYGNTIKNTNIASSSKLTGHSEGVITFSYTSGRVKIHDNLFLGGGESVLGNILYSNDLSNGANKDFYFQNNYCENYKKIVNWFWYSELDLVDNVDNVYITGNTFSNCGIDDWGAYLWQINRLGNIKFKNNLFINGTNVANIPLKML
jgi:hypothetical protein